MRHNRTQKGFTLAELLIVVGIIAVLVAISIPIFSNQLERARDAASVANIRAAYAMAQTEYMTCDIKNPIDKSTYQIKNNEGKEYMSVNFENGNINQIIILGVEIESRKANAWSHLGDDLPFAGKWVINKDQNGDSGIANTYRLVFTYDSNGNIEKVQFIPK